MDRQRSIVVRVVLLVQFALAGCAARPPDEQAIRAAITGAAAALAARDRDAIVDVLSADFIGNDSLGREEFDRFLRMQGIGARSLEASTSAISVTVDGERASAAFDVSLADSSGRWIPDRSTRVHVESAWRRERGAWRCFNARWDASR